MTDTNLPLNNQINVNDTNASSTLDNNQTSIEKKVKKSKETELTFKVVENPIRKLPSLINQLLEKNFSIILSKSGYYVEGFYGLNHEGNFGYAFGQETTEADTLVFYDAKGHKHVIKSFEDLVKFNSHVWGIFYKQSEDYKKPNKKWFSYMLEFGALNITPGK